MNPKKSDIFLDSCAHCIHSWAFSIGVMILFMSRANNYHESSFNFLSQKAKKVMCSVNWMLLIYQYLRLHMESFFVFFSSSNVSGNQPCGIAVGTTAHPVTNEPGHGGLCVSLTTVCLWIHVPIYQRLDAHSRASQHKRATPCKRNLERSE